uniref:Tafazzin n=2 Tax=Schistosoma TaxID=6181 RepID=A0A095BVX7_SCHHA
MLRENITLRTLLSMGRIIQPHERGSEKNIRLRWGIGRLIAESKEDPLVIPVWHCGLDQLNPSEVPNTSTTLSCIFGKPRQLIVVVGKPIDTHGLREELKNNSSEYLASSEFRSHIHSMYTQVVQEQLYKLKEEAEFVIDTYMLVPKLTDTDELQINHLSKIKKYKSDNIFTLFQSPHERIFPTDYDYSPRRNMKKFVPKYLQQRAYNSKNQNRRRTRRKHLRKTDCDEDIVHYNDDEKEYDYDDEIEDVDDIDRSSENLSKHNFVIKEQNYVKKRSIMPSHNYADIKDILTYQNTSDSCIFYLTFNSNKLIGPFIFHPYLNLLNMRNHREIPVNKIQITDQILDAAYDLERFILDETRRIHYPINHPYVDHNLTQIINDLIGNTQFTITVIDELREQINELKEENKNLRAQLEEYKNWADKNRENQYIEGPDEKVNESTFTWHAKLNALLDQYRAENEILKSHNYTLNQSQQALYQDQELMQQQNNKLKQQVDELKRSQNLILARSQSVLREERERMNREQEELSRELANVKKKLAQSPTQCPIHQGHRRSNIPVPNNDIYSVHDCPKHPILSKQDGEPTRMKRVRICSAAHSSRLPRLNIPGQTVNVPIKRSKKPETQTNYILRSAAYAKQNVNRQTIHQTTKPSK